MPNRGTNVRERKDVINSCKLRFREAVPGNTRKIKTKSNLLDGSAIRGVPRRAKPRALLLVRTSKQTNTQQRNRTNRRQSLVLI